MKNLNVLTSALLGIFLLAAQMGVAQSSKSFPAKNFEALAVSGDFETIYLKKGSEGVILKGSSDDIEKVKVEVRGKTLSLGLKKGKKLKGKVTVKVNFETIEKIANSGSSDFVTRSTIKGESLNLAFSGSGDFQGDIDVEKIKVAISGSADFELSGHAHEQVIAISGSGDVDASSLKGETARVAISGSGDVDLNVSGNVKSAVSGSGDVENRN